MTADRSFPDESSTSRILQPEHWEWLEGVSQRSSLTSWNSWRQRAGSNETPLRLNPVSLAMSYSLSPFARRGTSVSCQCALVSATDRWDTRFGGLDGHDKSAQGHPGGLSQRFLPKGAPIMTATSIARIVVPSLALVAACGAALGFGIMHVWREPPVETRAVIAAPEVSPPASGAQDNGSAALATAQAEANAAAAALAVPPRAPDTDESLPAFDIARIERTGDAVIAGTATPGAIVELLRNGEPHDRTVADKSGQFVMVPPRLPAGDYELNVPETVGKNRSAPDQVFGSAQARQSSQPPSQMAKRQDMAVSQPPRLAAATPLSDGGSPSTLVLPRTATTVVSRGDSLWRISRNTYGAGIRYAVVYKANQNQIRNPDRIYPGQVFVLPMNAR